MTGVETGEPHLRAPGADSASFLATVLDLASDAIISVALDGTILQTNRALSDMFRYRPGELDGKPLDVLIPEGSRGRHSALVAEFAASRSDATRMAGRAEILGLRSDGSTFPAEASIARIQSGGAPVLTAVIRDLTALREAEQALRRQEALFRSVLDGSPDLVSLLDLNGRILNLNSAHFAVLGFQTESLVGTDALVLVHPDDREFAGEWFVGRGAGARDPRTLRLVTAGGMTRWFEVHATAIPGNVREDGAVLLVSHDVSDRIASEEFLLEREEMFRATFEQAAVGMAHVAMDGAWLRVNSKLCDITGYTREELLALKFVDLTHPDDVGPDIAALAEFVAGERETFTTEKRYMCKSGDLVWVHLTVSLRRAEDGTPLHFVVVTEDISDRKATEAAAALAQATTEASFALLQSTLDGLTASVAVVDARGVVVQVNRAWREFAAATGAVARAGGIGANYFDACDSRTLVVLNEVLSGVRSEFRQEYALHDDDGGSRWFVMSAARAAGADGPLLVIAHEEVTELKSARRELERSTAALAVSLSAVAIVDTEGHLTYVNRAFARMWGYPTEQPVLGRALTEFWAEPERMTRVLHSLGSDPTWSGELRARRPGGADFVVQVSATRVTDDAGEAKGVMLSCVDVSDRTLAEDELRRSQASLSRAQEVAGMGNWDWDIQTNELWWSDQIYRIFGLKPQEFEATYPAFLERVHPEDRHLVEDGVAGALRGERYSIDHRIVRAGTGGSGIRVVHEVGEVIFSDDGVPLHMIGTVQDVTEARAMQNQLRHQRDLLSAVVRAAPVIILATDREGVFTLSDGRALARVGLEPGEVVGRSAFDMYEDVPGRADAIRRALSGESVNLQIGNGKLVFDAFYGPLFGPDGDIEGAVGVAVDVTDRERLQEQLGQAQKMEAIGRLAGGIAHDFNNLLTVILTYSSLAHDALPEGSDIREDIDEVLKASKRASQLTQQLLSFARKQVVQVETIDLNQALIDVDRMLRRLLGSDVEFVILFDEDAGHVRMDPGQFEQVVVNLVVNARDATPPGGTVTVSTLSMDLSAPADAQARGVEPGRYNGIRVTDTGTGMDDETVQRVFEPFFTTKGVGKGTGLGLATCYGIAQQTSGAIWVDSAPGAGTSITFVAPAVESEGRDRPAGLAGGSNLPAAGVLLVEDETQLRALAQRVLEMAGMSVTTAADGELALQSALASLDGIDLLVTDIVMPRLSGVELARQLLERKPGLKVLYMSGYASELPFPGPASGPSVAFISKPFTPTQLIETVHRLLVPQR